MRRILLQPKHGDTPGEDMLNPPINTWRAKLPPPLGSLLRSPDEHPFTPISKLPPPLIAVQSYPPLLHPQSTQHPSTNVNNRILKFYVEEIVPAITKRVVLSGKAKEERDDGNYGSSATRDVDVLQALSRRIHFGERRYLAWVFPGRVYLFELTKRNGVLGYKACSYPSRNSAKHPTSSSLTSSPTRPTPRLWRV
jgi:hypothetical protein